jgi:hypothetical protein
VLILATIESRVISLIQKSLTAFVVLAVLLAVSAKTLNLTIATVGVVFVLAWWWLFGRPFVRLSPTGLVIVNGYRRYSIMWGDVEYLGNGTVEIGPSANAWVLAVNVVGRSKPIRCRGTLSAHFTRQRDEHARDVTVAGICAYLAAHAIPTTFRA